MSDDPRRYAPSALRNRDPILNVLRRHLPKSGLVLEIASGSGEHITYFAGASVAELVYQPSDPDDAARASIDAWVAERGLTNVQPAIAIDAAAQTWPIAHADAVICINMVHIAPWDAAVGLVCGASRILSTGGLLYFYGPFRKGGAHTAASNAAFDQELQSRNPAWGVRELEKVSSLAAGHGFSAPLIEEMPVNNLSLIFRRRS